MLTLTKNNNSYTVMEFNKVNKGKGVFQFWITRPNNKSLLVKEGNEKEIQEMYDAFVYAIDNDVKMIDVR